MVADSACFEMCQLSWVFRVYVSDVFKESALGRFFHRVAMSVYLSVPFHVIF